MYRCTRSMAAHFSVFYCSKMTVVTFRAQVYVECCVLWALVLAV